MSGILGAMVSAGNRITTTFNLTAATIAGSSGAGYNDATAGTIGSAGGSVSSNALGVSKTIAEAISTSTPNDRLIVKGFSANPGSSWLLSATINTHVQLGSAGSFSYDAPNGAATWLWATPQWGMINGNTYNGNTIVHLP